MPEFKLNDRVRGWNYDSRKWRRGTYQWKDEQGHHIVKWDLLYPRTQILELVPEGQDNEDSDDPHLEEPMP